MTSKPGGGDGGAAVAGGEGASAGEVEPAGGVGESVDGGGRAGAGSWARALEGTSTESHAATVEREVTLTRIRVAAARTTRA
jgi:hypothetical protein